MLFFAFSGPAASKCFYCFIKNSVPSVKHWTSSDLNYIGRSHFILVNDIMSMFHHFSLFFFTIHKFWNGALYMICQKLAVKTSKNRPVTPLLLSHQFEIEKIWLLFFPVFSGDFFFLFSSLWHRFIESFSFYQFKGVLDVCIKQWSVTVASVWRNAADF